MKIFIGVFLLLGTISFSQTSASITQGVAPADVASIYDCGRHPAPIGKINSTDGKTWDLPAKVNYLNNSFPFTSDLYNNCIGETNANLEAAMGKLDGSDIIEIDADGAVYSAYVFADNYFEMYVNSVPVGKDKVPFTEFNSAIIRFKVNRPFTLSMLLVDWEVGLGVGTESSPRTPHHPGDGGVAVVVKDQAGQIIAISNQDWKAQTFYVSPVKNLNCFSEQGGLRNSNNCNTDDAQNADNFYGLHWERPQNWTAPSFDDSNWPNAYEFTNELINVGNRAAYSNFTDVFDDPNDDAVFIWSSNIILDNEVLVRYTVPGSGTPVKSNPKKLKPSIQNELRNLKGEALNSPMRKNVILLEAPPKTLK